MSGTADAPIVVESDSDNSSLDSDYDQTVKSVPGSLVCSQRYFVFIVIMRSQAELLLNQECSHYPG